MLEELIRRRVVERTVSIVDRVKNADVGGRTDVDGGENNLAGRSPVDEHPSPIFGRTGQLEAGRRTNHSVGGSDGASIVSRPEFGQCAKHIDGLGRNVGKGLEADLGGGQSRIRPIQVGEDEAPDFRLGSTLDGGVQVGRSLNLGHAAITGDQVVINPSAEEISCRQRFLRLGSRLAGG